jgi:hypothetical protein
MMKNILCFPLCVWLGNWKSEWIENICVFLPMCLVEVIEEWKDKK